MTVSELIEILQALPGELQVSIWDPYEDNETPQVHVSQVNWGFPQVHIGNHSYTR